jgi:hypothetical protein
MNEYSLASMDMMAHGQGHPVEMEVLTFSMICQTTREDRTSLQLPRNATKRGSPFLIQ